MKNDNNTLKIILIAVLVLLLLGSLGRGMMGGDNLGFVFLNSIVSMLVYLVTIILIIWGIFWLIKNVNFNQKGRK